MNEKHEEGGAKKKDRMIADALGEDIAITPSDIYNQDFKRSLMGGYETREVDAFLERVADIIEHLLGQIRYLRERVDEQRSSIDEYREIEKTLRSALVSSQKFSEDILASAKREAESLIEEARLKKAQAQLAAAKLPRKLARDIHVLEQQRSRMRREMMAILETHKNLLDSLIPEEETTPASFFDAGVANESAEEDEGSDLPVLNIADEPEDADDESRGFASFPTESPAAEPSESPKQVEETPPAPKSEDAEAGQNGEPAAPSPDSSEDDVADTDAEEMARKEDSAT